MNHNSIYDLTPLKLRNLQKQLRKFVMFIAKVSILTTKSETGSENMSLRDELRPGHSSDLNQDALKELVECNSGKSTQKLVLDLNTSQSTIC